MDNKQLTEQEFTDSPWENKNLHPSYKKSFLNFSNAPEYAPSEVLLASLYRRIGLRHDATEEYGSGKALPEGSVGTNGTAMMNLIEKRSRKVQPEAKLSIDGWQQIVHDVIRSPRQPNQRAKKYIQMTPVVPSTAIYTMAARLRGNPWNPGSLIESSLCFGATSEEKVNSLWKKLFDALSVKQNEDDAWAVFLEQEFTDWKDDNITWAFAGNVDYADWMQDWQQGQIECPARRFAQDLAHITKAKPYLTRRQWTSALESILRIGLGAHVLWVSKVNYELYNLCEKALHGNPTPTKESIKLRLSTGDGFWSYGQLVGSHIKKLLRNYMYGRVGLNLLLHRCQSIPSLAGYTSDGPFNSVSKIQKFLKTLSKHRDEFNLTNFQEKLDACLEADPRKLASKQGIGKNMEEFLRHSLGQRQTHERGLESYDQGYLLGRKGTYSRAPWAIAAGPVLILALVYSCTSDGSGARTVEDLCKHLGEYGVKINPNEVANNSLGTSLRTLGLVLDSPDAEGGMVLLNPFSSRENTNN
jgi:hypothetical protein